MKNKEKVILDAQNLLFKNYFDIAHDIFHHYKVWERCMTILMVENLKVEKALLEIAAWWHDIGKTDIQNSREEDHSSLKLSMQKEGYSDEEYQKVVEIIEGHKFENVPQSTEARILFDADKLEYSTIPRWLLCQNLQNEVRIEYEQKWARAMKVLPERLNFEYSKKIFFEELKILLNVAKEHDVSLQKNLIEEIWNYYFGTK